MLLKQLFKSHPQLINLKTTKLKHTYFHSAANLNTTISLNFFIFLINLQPTYIINSSNITYQGTNYYLLPLSSTDFNMLYI